MGRELAAILRLLDLVICQAMDVCPEAQGAVRFIGEGFQDRPVAMGTLLSWLFVHSLGRLVDDAGFAQVSRQWIDRLLLDRAITRALLDGGLHPGAASYALQTVRVLTRHQGWWHRSASDRSSAYRSLASWLDDSDVRQLVQANRHDGILWFNKESFEHMLRWMLVTALVTAHAGRDDEEPTLACRAAEAYAVVEELRQVAEESDYRLDSLLRTARRLS
jgi:hypothetical protein